MEASIICCRSRRFQSGLSQFLPSFASHPALPDLGRRKQEEEGLGVEVIFLAVTWIYEEPWLGFWVGLGFRRIEATRMEVVIQNDEMIEVSFSRTWNSSSTIVVPVNIDKRFVMLRNSSGFYTYAIFERLQGWPVVELDNIRLAFKLNKDKFSHMAISDERQRYMPLPYDRNPPRGQALAYPVAVKILDPVEPEFKGETNIEEEK